MCIHVRLLMCFLPVNVYSASIDCDVLYVIFMWLRILYSCQCIINVWLLGPQIVI